MRPRMLRCARQQLCPQASTEPPFTFQAGGEVLPAARRIPQEATGTAGGRQWFTGSSETHAVPELPGSALPLPWVVASLAGLGLGHPLWPGPLGHRGME